MSRRIEFVIKRIFDLVVSLIGLIVASPIMFLVAALVKLTSNGPVLFCQDRLGKDATIFKLYKFRTMVPNAVNIGAGLTVSADDTRITPIGSFLRKSSLDELPQLFNVLKGDISLVGPRPAIPQHLEYYGEFERRRLEMKPGVTGWAVVNGRSTNPWSVRIKYDVAYIDNFSLWLDFKILFRTIKVVLLRQDTYYDHNKNGPAFDLTRE